MVTDLGLTNKSFVDTYDARRGKWEQHGIETIRVVEPQERVLYRIRRSLLEGLNENECLGLREELHSQQFKHGRPQPLPPPPPTQQAKVEWQPSRGQLKRPAPEPSSQPPHAPKVHVTNGYYLNHAGNPNPIASPSSPSVASTSALLPAPVDPSIATPNMPGPPPKKNGPYAYQPTAFYIPPTPNAASPSSTLSPSQSTSSPPDTSPPIPYHPHPPLKRWPNDYTVSELTAGFLAMEDLVAQAPAGAAMTQRAAFERIFGSRYVKSTVCRHRGVWKKSKGPLREQFEAMGTDERACWGEFIRRVEGRPPAKNLALSHSTPGPPPTPSVMMYPGTIIRGHLAVIGAGTDNIQNQMIPPQPGENTSRVEEEPIMGSLQKPEGESIRFDWFLLLELTWHLQMRIRCQMVSSSEFLTGEGFDWWQVRAFVVLA